MPNRAKTILIYAPSGDTKTTQAVHIARYVKEKYGKTTRLISSDGGGWAPVEDEGLIITRNSNNEATNDGIVDAFNMTNRPMYLADWRYLASGKWPKVVNGNKELGEDPTKKYRRIANTNAEDMGKVGCYFIEGLTSVGSGFISHIGKQDNSKESLTKVMYSAPGYDQGGEHFGATDQGHVGMVQNELHNLTQQFGTLPVDLIVWTALVNKATEKSLRVIGMEGEDNVYGPKLAGNAKTAEAPSWFSDCLHLDSKVIDGFTEGGDRTQYKRIFAYFERHKMEDGSVFLAKSSIGPSLYPKMKKMYPGGYVELSYEEGIDKYLREIDKLKEK